MKKLLLTLLALPFLANAAPVHTTLTGTNAVIAASQIAALTNFAGQPVIASASTNQPNTTVIIRIIRDTNGTPQTVTIITR